MTNLSGFGTATQNLRTGRDILHAACSKSMPHDFSQRLAALVDRYFSERLAEAVAEGILSDCEDLCVLAVGGYGRGKLSPFSDLDVLVLTDLSEVSLLEGLAAFLFHPLWDLKFDVGHAVRTVQQNIELAKIDFKVLASFLDLRFLAGNNKLYKNLSSKFAEEVLPVAGSSFCNTLWENRQTVGVGMDSVVLEPDLKNGWGTLRDVQFVHWCACIKGNYSPLNEKDLDELRDGEALLIRARSALHLTAGRKVDRLDIERVADVAELCGVKGYSPAKRGNDLLNKLHSAMINVRSMGDALYRESFIKDLRTFIEWSGPISLKSALELFEHKSRTGNPLTREARRAVSNINSEIDISLGDALTLLIKIFEAPYGWRTSLEMLDSGLFDSFLPEFSKVAALIPYDGYHRYPPGRHTLLAVQKCCSIYRDEFEGLENPDGVGLTPADFDILMLGAFFHDIGKGGRAHSERGAEITSEILSRTSFSEPFKDDVVFLVREHLSLIKAARRIDLSDGDSLLEVAGKVGSLRRLKLLFILSMADSMATGPRAWNSWSESLLRELYSGLNQALAEESMHKFDNAQTIAETKAAVMVLASEVMVGDTARSMIEAMPDRYLLSEEPEEIVCHMKQVREFNSAYEKDLIRKPGGKGGKGLNLVRAAQNGGNGRTKIVISARDQDFLFAAQTGALSLHSINILSADIFSWADGTAVNIFTVETPPAETTPADIWARVERAIMYSMTGRLSLDYRLHKKRNSLLTKAKLQNVPTQILVDNESSELCTIVEVRTQDRSGILYGMAVTFSRMNIDLRMARISTTGDSVFDVFHVESAGCGKIEDREYLKELVGALDYALASVK
ncbi:HD domain-containing protein [Desulfovibrio gilichinskyi]|uniref:Bifunctional uridylyltransferase/uridylyl-removing enzyme n=1 Tax=Desulfovibrio gilichinskyi TaxID=1519643 RepID=A0A1X7EMT8_9BACT|nr:HD domain-containing protein [Desulfovibrio gilichinskyi]SMF36250.1 UTP--GlnB (protein PII) uridylyltransferase, GlnD [Desulfovibrio gilichinskyi]